MSTTVVKLTPAQAVWLRAAVRIRLEDGCEWNGGIAKMVNDIVRQLEQAMVR